VLTMQIGGPIKECHVALFNWLVMDKGE